MVNIGIFYVAFRSISYYKIKMYPNFPIILGQSRLLCLYVYSFNFLRFFSLQAVFININNCLQSGSSTTVLLF